MKRFFTFIIACLFSFSMFAAQETFGKTVVNGIETTYGDAKGTVTTIYSDAKGTVTTMYDDAKAVVSNIYSDSKDLAGFLYPDIKTALTEIAKSLGVAVEYVWTILVKQYIVKGVAELLIFILALTLIIIGVVMLNKYIKNNTKVNWKILPSIILIICGIFSGINVDYAMMLQGLINPEFGAMNYVLEFVKTLK